MYTWQSTSGMPPAAELLDEGDEGHLRGVRLAGEHGLAEEGGPEREAVEPPDERLAPPGLDGVGDAAAVELGVGLDHPGSDPGAVLAGPGHGGAGDHDLRERGVEGDAEEAPPHRPAEAAGDHELVRQQDHARVGRVPVKRLALPGEDAHRVGEEQPLGAQVPAHGDGPPPWAALRGREHEALVEAIDGHGAQASREGRAGRPHQARRASWQARASVARSSASADHARAPA